MPDHNFPADRSGRHDGRALLAALSMALGWLEANLEPINRLNVFPVPDGDTGTNMFLTLRSGVDAAGKQNSHSAGTTARAAYEGALIGARGNSGVILSQIVRGFSVGLSDHEIIGVKQAAAAFAEAASAGYDAVAEPVEGTMLTVARKAGEAALDAVAREGLELVQLLAIVSAAARQAVIETPTQLEVLRQANVVDAGGEGVAIIYDGLRMYFAGEQLPESAVDNRDEAAFAEFAAEHAGDEHGFCTQFLLDGEGLNLGAMRAWMREHADSTVVVGDEKRIRVHVHTEMPGEILNYAIPMGSVSHVSIENMDLQQEAQFAAVKDSASPARAELPPPEAGLVAVAAGAGFVRLFSDFGATVVEGGQTMNPSVREIAEAIARNPSDEVVVLPNNKNIILAANGARDISPKQVTVIETRSIPQGVAAVLAYVPTFKLESNLAAMHEAVAAAVSIEVTRAVRDATIDSIAIGRGEYMCLVDGKLVAANESYEQALRSGLDEISDLDPEIVSVYWGADATQQQAEELEDLFAAVWPEVEFECLHGGQDHYEFVIGIE